MNGIPEFITCPRCGGRHTTAINFSPSRGRRISSCNNCSGSGRARNPKYVSYLVHPDAPKTYRMMTQLWYKHVPSPNRPKKVWEGTDLSDGQLVNQWPINGPLSFETDEGELSRYFMILDEFSKEWHKIDFDPRV